MGLEVPDRFDRMPDMITAQEFIVHIGCYSHIQKFHKGLARGQS